MGTKKKAGKNSAGSNKVDKSLRPSSTTAKEDARLLKQKEKFDVLRAEIISIVLFMLAVFTYICVSQLQGLAGNEQFVGLLGSGIMKGLQLLLGDGAFIASFYLLLWSIHIGVLKKYWSSRMWGITLLALVFVIEISIYHIPGGLNALEAGSKGMGGGYIGGSLAYALVRLLGNVGTIIFLLLGVLVALVQIIDKPLGQIFNTSSLIAKKIWTRVYPLLFEDEEEPASPTAPKKEPVIIDSHEQPRLPSFEELYLQPDIPLETAAGKEELKEEPIPSEARKGSLRLVLSAQEEESETEYQKPPLELLSNVSSERKIDKKNIKESISVMEETFANFGIGVKVNQVSCGPAVTRYEMSPAPGVKISRIISLADDLQLNLAAPGIRIEAPIPGKSAIGIEVPNNKILSVGLRNLISSPSFSKLNSPLAFALGEDISGTVVVARLNDMPHLLIAGSTGSGKSVCLNSIIMSFLYNTTPSEMKMVFIDPKMVELTVYNGIPHLLTPVVTDPRKASVVLRWMVSEMEKRYKLFSERGVRDIQRYNLSAQDKLPYIVIVIDELADLMMVSPVEVEDSICRLAQMARAAGMHLIVATQRPSVDVVTGIIKANIPSRIAFAVSSQADSRTILDSAGAEKLLGKGDMLFFPVGAIKPYRIQGAFVSDSDIEASVNFIKEQFVGQEEPEPPRELELSFQEAENDWGDDLFWDAVNVFVDSKKASVSLLQRRLRIGYARAARLVDLMEERGIVSEMDNNKKREILINSEQLEKLYAKNKLC
ncbi:MAG: DNA translocase FtsK 4TM domain-containing protein [Syntrophomonadaceae bacterium]|nr:DNA translocase FtsK 4TM domain-containing protein [Syntrophomonadaceae bacterium]MDD3271721.1 DNA translocase FtsK 4TM domain-containing protein [Syntrophomonadaceae bacterium]MDD3897367.1 DNA translocase FtsK 4TM domain-containing protein [Syntrophomonadaceae bacterium]MDD4562144.1 DNA translocase FtsK 4TM domain-containing protein [Syntrophomonadaceae bacterium]